MSMFILIGAILILVGIIISLPFLGLGLIIPGIGDMIDIPLGIAMAVGGLILLFLGGLGEFFKMYWWIFVAGFALWYGSIALKMYAGTKRRLSR